LSSAAFVNSRKHRWRYAAPFLPGPRGVIFSSTTGQMRQKLRRHPDQPFRSVAISRPHRREAQSAIIFTD
jgi:hypothetical protein